MEKGPGAPVVPRAPISCWGPGLQLTGSGICSHLPPPASPGQVRWDLVGAVPSTSLGRLTLFTACITGTPKPSPAWLLSKPSCGSAGGWGLGERPGDHPCHLLQPVPLLKHPDRGHQSPSRLCGWLTGHACASHTQAQKPKPHGHIQKAISVLKHLGIT